MAQSGHPLNVLDLHFRGLNMLERIVQSFVEFLETVPPWSSTDEPHNELLRGFGVLFLILLTLFLLSYIRWSASSSLKDKGREK